MVFQMAFKPLALLCKPISITVGFIYPSWASYKALESKSPVAAAQWLTYWVVFSLFTVLEYFADYVISWLPLYYLLKLGFILWLQLPQTQGATQLYIKCVQPLVKKHEEEIDRALEQGWKKVEDHVFEVKSKTMTWLSGQQVKSRNAPSSAAGSGTSLLAERTPSDGALNGKEPVDTV
mmetsp:Transcript_8375/g.17295  ORF Transcript_8375/g.17295 Transcript_8375/m.17295 type:complete len:178 (-) Transcript_8375:79-612(-)|eukprot:CAMPEP_0118956958 /NCGR_PEP_ID=MMETSP1169-20130426/61850_1 /TAXON_ID=36882 /ORGANISM="Pyramimonas obovata, Strain CCMP722" /LENGTH=177 /DNA_ID=CAMNT_0006905009 /DNA_START=244 /DNA_END=777 /DNA_ORIENTATION=+